MCVGDVHYHVRQVQGAGVIFGNSIKRCIFPLCISNTENMGNLPCKWLSVAQQYKVIKLAEKDGVEIELIQVP